ncbi:class I SAM-dependent methyltransferase [Butyrivibrio hungatei]|uniref:class I SAM-dependent methyltransferase n=1 Tax=Butyrivibrio hungatei TaxID=185008 RepID=UPI00041C2ABF|nr:class I SAM-dependent methyltransferase [Butyrivibrio hungatei]
MFSIKKNKWNGSANYWENRYKKGGNSGAGSYNRLADFKAEIVNGLIEDANISTVIEWGCGDGNQLSLMKYPQYIGYDVSKTAIELCKKKYTNDNTKQFYWTGDKIFSPSMADMVVSLDVIFHLVEDDVFEDYMKKIFESCKKMLVIYSSNIDDNYVEGNHCRNRKFTDWIQSHKQYSENWELYKYIKNKYPFDGIDGENTSISDFYIYVKKEEYM